MFATISELNRENHLDISTEVSKRIERFLKLVDSADRSNIEETQNYYDAITTSPLYFGVEKTKTKIPQMSILTTIEIIIDFIVFPESYDFIHNIIF